MTVQIGQLIDQMWEHREDKRALEEKVKKLEKKIAETEALLLAGLESNGLDKASGKKASVAVQESIVPQVEDWDAFYKYILRNKYTHLLERRPSVTGCRELFETKGKIPGVMPFTKRKIHLLTLKG